jgi:hypothetical protein
MGDLRQQLKGIKKSMFLTPQLTELYQLFEKEKSCFLSVDEAKLKLDTMTSSFYKELFDLEKEEKRSPKMFSAKSIERWKKEDRWFKVDIYGKNAFAIWAPDFTHGRKKIGVRALIVNELKTQQGKVYCGFDDEFIVMLKSHAAERYVQRIKKDTDRHKAVAKILISLFGNNGRVDVFDNEVNKIMSIVPHEKGFDVVSGHYTITKLSDPEKDKMIRLYRTIIPSDMLNITQSKFYRTALNGTLDIRSGNLVVVRNGEIINLPKELRSVNDN